MAPSLLKFKVRFQSDVVAHCTTTGGPLGEEFTTDLDIVVTVDQFDILQFEVESKSLVSFANSKTKVVGTIGLTVMNLDYNLLTITND